MAPRWTAGKRPGSGAAGLRNLAGNFGPSRWGWGHGVAFVGGKRASRQEPQQPGDPSRPRGHQTLDDVSGDQCVVEGLVVAFWTWNQLSHQSYLLPSISDGHVIVRPNAARVKLSRQVAAVPPRCRDKLGDLS